MDQVLNLLRLTSILFAVGQLIQTLEYWNVRKAWLPSGVWTPQVIAQEWESLAPSWWEKSFQKYLFKKSWFWHQGFYLVLIAKGISAISLFIYPTYFASGLLMLSLIYTNLRWRGTFNGGSDMMSVVVGCGLTWSLYFLNRSTDTSSNYDYSFLIKAGLFYIGVQSVISYFIAGLIKIQKRNWRNGLALNNFLKVSVFSSPHSNIQKLLGAPNLIMVLGWTAILAEMMFPLAFISQTAALILILWAGLFHFTNIYLFGLNRFFWAWAATWPSILLLSLR